MRTMKPVYRIHAALWACAALGVAAATLTACDDEDYMLYNDSYSGIYFKSDTLRYSFGVTPTDVVTREYRIPVYLMGKPANADRTFAYSVQPADEQGGRLTPAQDGVQYRVGQPVISADSVNGYIPVTLYRQQLLGDYLSGYKRYVVNFRLESNAWCTPTLSAADNNCVLVFDNAVEQPEWLRPDGSFAWPDSRLGVWHPLKLIKLVEYFHALADILPESYVKMVERYGENLEHVQYGDFYEFNVIVKKYMLKPEYDYFADPANRDEILAGYPDFPFDFPDPYA